MRRIQQGVCLVDRLKTLAFWMCQGEQAEVSVLVSAAKDIGALLALFWVDCAGSHDAAKARGAINRA